MWRSASLKQQSIFSGPNIGNLSGKRVRKDRSKRTYPFIKYFKETLQNVLFSNLLIALQSNIIVKYSIFLKSNSNKQP